MKKIPVRVHSDVRPKTSLPKVTFVLHVGKKIKIFTECTAKGHDLLNLTVKVSSTLPTFILLHNRNTMCHFRHFSVENH